MKTHTQAFKNAIKEYGRQFNDIITYDANTLTQEQINSVTISYDSDLLKSQMKSLVIDSNVEITQGTTINYQIGLKIGNSYECLDYGNYIVKKVEQQKDKKSYLITCYDKMLLSMVDYESLGVTYPITIRNYLSAICTKLDITFHNSSDTFTNYNKEVTSEHYLDSDGNSMGYTFRDVLDDIAECIGGFIVINNDDELEIKQFTTTNDTINEDYFNDKNVNINKKYGPINTIVLSRAEADNLYYPSTLPANPIEIKISNNPILEQTNRDTFIQGIYNNLNGLEYYLNDFQTKGILYYELGDKYNVNIEGTTYPCLMLNDTITRTTGLKEQIYTNEPKTSVTDFKYASSTDKLDIQSRNAYIIANKAEGKIDQVVTAVGDNGQVTSASIIQAINDDTSSITLNADKISLEGYTTINDGFSIDEDGSVEINNGNIYINNDTLGNMNRIYMIYKPSGQNDFHDIEIRPDGTTLRVTYNNSSTIENLVFTGGSFKLKRKQSSQNYSTGMEIDAIDGIKTGIFDNNSQLTYGTNIDADGIIVKENNNNIFEVDTANNYTYLRSCGLQINNNNKLAMKVDQSGYTTIDNLTVTNNTTINGNTTISGTLNGNSEVVVGGIRTKNMFNGLWTPGAIDSSTGNIINNYTDYSLTTTNLIKVKPNTTYTISFSGGNYVIDRIATFNSSGAFISKSNSLNVRTFTTDANTYYIRFNIWSSGITPSSIGNAQLEEGSTATTYTPYQELDNKEHYTTSEQVIGTWVDGKKLYRKVVKYTNSSTIGSSSGITNISIAHGVSNIGQVTKCDIAKAGNYIFTTLGGSGVSYGTCVTQVNNTNINLRIINDTWASSTWYFTLEYTKTTD